MQAQLAAGRLVGSLAVVTAQEGDASAAMLASWVSQVTKEKRCNVWGQYACVHCAGPVHGMVNEPKATYVGRI